MPRTVTCSSKPKARYSSTTEKGKSCSAARKMGDTRSLLMGRMIRNDHSNDLTVTSLESWLIRGSIPKRPYFRLVKYYNLPRSDHFGECPKNSQRYHDALFLTGQPQKGPKALCQRAGWPTIMEPFRPGFSSKPIRKCYSEPRVVSKHWLANCFLCFMFFVCFLLQGLIHINPEFLSPTNINNMCMNAWHSLTCK